MSKPLHSDVDSPPPDGRTGASQQDAEVGPHPAAPAGSDWRDAGLRMFGYNYQLRQKYGRRVQRVSIDAGFTCPNVDGTVAKGGCVFCDNRSFSPSRRLPKQDVLDQIDEGIRGLKRRYKCDDFIAYFQPATNTYAPVERLRPLYEKALTHSKILGMAIGTRPDCVPDDVMDLLEEMSGKTDLTVEYGMQTVHDRSLDWMNRGHHHDAFVDAMARSRNKGFEICAHVILGIPGESHEDMLETARELARIGVDAVKMHNLYAVKYTPMGEEVERGELEMMSLRDYITTLVDFLELTPPNVVIERVSGEAPPDYFIGPAWALDKPVIRKALEDELERRDSWQGKRYVATP